jgi:hypothetical protein
MYYITATLILPGATIFDGFRGEKHKTSSRFILKKGMNLSSTVYPNSKSIILRRYAHLAKATRQGTPFPRNGYFVTKKSDAAKRGFITLSTKTTA